MRHHKGIAGQQDSYYLNMFGAFCVDTLNIPDHDWQTMKRECIRGQYIYDTLLQVVKKFLQIFKTSMLAIQLAGRLTPKQTSWMWTLNQQSKLTRPISRVDTLKSFALLSWLGMSIQMTLLLKFLLAKLHARWKLPKRVLTERRTTQFQKQSGTILNLTFDVKSLLHVNKFKNSRKS